MEFLVNLGFEVLPFNKVHMWNRCHGLHILSFDEFGVMIMGRAAR